MCDEFNMNTFQDIDTFDALIHLGFQPDDDVYSDIRPGLSYDFGSLKLSAGCMMSLQMIEIVSFGGLIRTPDCMVSVEFDMPRRVESLEQCAAWIAWHFQEQLPARVKIPKSKIDLLVFGLQHKSTLPWK